MPNFPGPICGQQAVTNAAQPLASAIPGNPLGAGSVRGEGRELILENLKASNASFFYGGNNSVTVATGKEVAPGSQDVIRVNDTSQVYVIAANNNNATVSWSLSAM